MKLYYHPLSTYSHKAMLALYEKDIDFEREVVALFDPEQQARYREKYPIGKIPLLELDDGYKIPESTTIIEYLDAHFGGTQLIPEGIDAARQTRFMDRMTDLYVNDQVALLLFQSWKDESERDPERIANAHRLLDVSFAHLDAELADHDWIRGDQFSMADCALIPPLLYAKIVKPFEHHQNLTAYYERAKARPSYSRVLEEQAPAWEAMQNQS